MNGDGSVNANDAAEILVAAARIGAGSDSGLTAEELAAGDVNGDGATDATDAATVLRYAAYVGSGGNDTLREWLAADQKQTV